MDAADYFSSRCKDGVAIIGNGNSLLSLSACDIDLLNRFPQMRSNWWFEDPSTLRHDVRVYFVGLPENRMLEKYRQSGRTAECMVSTKNTANVDLWFSSVELLRGMDSRWRPVPTRWPLSGTQMFCAAAVYGRGPILVAGIDFYMVPNQDRTIKAFGYIDSSLSPYERPDKPHSLEIDVQYFVEALRKTDPDRVKCLGGRVGVVVETYKAMAHEEDATIISRCCENIRCFNEQET